MHINTDKLQLESMGTIVLISIVLVLIEIGRQFEPHYPELLRHAVIVNCKISLKGVIMCDCNVVYKQTLIFGIGPYIFEVCYGVVAPVIAKRTREKVHIFGTNRSTWKQHIADQIPVTIIPDQYR